MIAKRPRGRPRKNPLPNGTPMERAIYTAPSVVSTPIQPPVLLPDRGVQPGEYWVQLAQVAQGTEVWLRTRKA